MNDDSEELMNRCRCWTDVRAQFELAPDLIHLAAMSHASHPKPVRESIRMYRDRLNRNPKVGRDDIESNDTRILRAAGRFLQVSPNQIALTDSTTMGLGLVCTSLMLERGDEILSSIHSHYSLKTSLDYAEQRSQISNRRVALYDEHDPSTAAKEDIVENLVAGINDATRVVALTWVHSSSGVKLPLKRISRRIRLINRSRTPDRKILILVDGVHALGAENFHLSGNDCDFFVAGCHKLLCGPRGTGIIWASDRGWRHVQPTIPPFGQRFITDPRSGEQHPRIAIGRKMTPGGYHSFEHRWSLDKAFEFQRSLGRKRIQKRFHRLARSCKQRLVQMPHVKLVTPLSQTLSSSLICFNVDGWDPQELEHHLHGQGIVSTASPTNSCLRFSPGLYSNFADLRRAAQQIENLK